MTPSRTVGHLEITACLHIIYAGEDDEIRGAFFFPSFIFRLVYDHHINYAGSIFISVEHPRLD